MKARLLLLTLGVIATALLGACSKLSAPVSGTYRAYVKLRGGEVPFELRVNEQDGRPTLAMVRGDELHPALNVQLQANELQAQLPDAAGSLHASFSRNGMEGEVRLTDHLGKPQTLPFVAELNKTYRFVEKSSTDNADVSGYWQLEAVDPKHFSAPVTVQLQQHFDAVDGQLLLPDGKPLPLVGQMHGDELYLSAFAQGRAVLLKGKFNAQGELVGELWTNLSDAKHWAARRLSEEGVARVEREAQLRPVPVTLHWAVPIATEVR